MSQLLPPTITTPSSPFLLLALVLLLIAVFARILEWMCERAERRNWRERRLRGMEGGEREGKEWKGEGMRK